MTQRTISHYQLERQLGEGGMGAVWLARDLVLEREVAIKLLGTNTAGDPEFLERFKREARLAASLNHPNIATIYEFGEDQGEAFLAMELVDGETLSQKLNRGPLPLDEVRRLGRQAALALAAAHDRGIVHRDIKAPNLMLTRDGTLKVMDFGVSRRVGETQLTMAGALVGTAHIMAPEIIQGQQAGPEADLFSLGCVLYEMIAGTAPFHGDDPMQVLFRIVNQAAVPLTEYRDDVPADLLGLVEGLLEKDPAERFGPARAVAAALDGSAPAAPRPTDSDATQVFTTEVLPRPEGKKPERTDDRWPTGQVDPSMPAQRPGDPLSDDVYDRRRMGRLKGGLWMLAALPFIIGVAAGVMWLANRGGAPDVSTLQDANDPTGIAPTAATQIRDEAKRQNDAAMQIYNRFPAEPAPVDPDSVRAARLGLMGATRTDPTYALPWYNLGKLYLRAGQVDEARQFRESGLEKLPDDPLLLMGMGEVEEASGNPAAALEDYRRAYENLDATVADPIRLTIYNNLGFLYLDQGKPIQAYDVLNTATAEFPDQAPIWKNLGRAQLALDTPADAETSFRKALDLAGGSYPAAEEGLTEALAAQGKPAGN